MKKPVYCYILLCENQAFYTGWTKNIPSRFQQHKKGNGSRYTKQNKPIKIIYWENCKDRSSAMKRELEIKKFNRKQKEKLVSSWQFMDNLPEEFNQYEYLSVAPGRVNILGEHIDYNGGSVLPAAIDRYVYLAANKRNDGIITIHSLDLQESVSFQISEIEKKIDSEGNPLPNWALYPAGVFWSAKKIDLEISGFNAIFTSTIPMGAGLSSSAAVEVAFGALMREMCSWDVSNLELAKLCQFAENQYIGVNCGLMDQFASANGVKDSLLLFDTMTTEWFPIEIPDSLSIVITNSNIPRSLSNSAYNERRESCEIALSILQKFQPGISNLCQITTSTFDQIGDKLEKQLHKRAKHVVYECDRVKQSIHLLKNDQLSEFGNLMRESHLSLSELYEVSTPELDLLVSIANNLPGCIGSRLTGAGFGGCIVSLVQKETVQEFVNQLESKFTIKTGKEIETYVCEPSDGVKVFWRDLSISND